MYDHSAGHLGNGPLSAADLAELRLRFDLVGAVGRGELEAYYQPQWDAATNELVAFEALCRWDHPRLGMVSPTQFISMAEDMGTIHAIGVFMVDEACSFAARLHQLGKELDVSINMSVAQFASDYATDHLIDVIADRSLDASHITVEVTETLEITDLDPVVERLARLRESGVGVSIDDFGAGYASRAQVVSLPATEVKVDRSIVQSDPDEARETIRELVKLASEQSLRTVAEGVETAEQLSMIRDEGCDRVQGFYLGRPAPRKELELGLAS